MTRPAAVTLRFPAEPNPVHWGGKVQGGVALKWINRADTACTLHRAEVRCTLDQEIEEWLRGWDPQQPGVAER